MNAVCKQRYTKCKKTQKSIYLHYNTYLIVPNISLALSSIYYTCIYDEDPFDLL